MQPVARDFLRRMPQAAGIAAGETVTRVSANWLVSTYLVLTFAELFLSPMGISFVSKVAPPKDEGYDDGWLVCSYCHR